VFGLIAAAQKRVQDKALEDERLAQERIRHLVAGHQLPPQPTTPNTWQRPPAPDPTTAPPRWAMSKRANRPFFGYRLRDGSVWVYFELEDGKFGLRKLYGREEWYVGLSPKFGTYDHELDLIVSDSAPAFASVAVSTRISSNFADLRGL
jgi:hypothetical protein